MLDFSKLRENNDQNKTTVESPKEVFNKLPQEKYSYLRDVQSEVLDKWFARRTEKNNIIKMNTGAGKTLIGLLILKTLISEKKGKAVYVVPDNFLVSQVKNTAQDLGIDVAEDHTDAKYLDGIAIYICNINKLINGKSVFGFNQATAFTPDYIIFDDSHACIKSIKEQFCLNMKNSTIAYKRLFDLFSNTLEYQSPGTYSDIKNGDPAAIMRVPFYTWLDNLSTISNILSAYARDARDAKDDKEDKKFLFKYPLIREYIDNCEAVISGSDICVFPIYPSISELSPLKNAKNIIYMSATFSNDGDLAIELDLTDDVLNNKITPSNIGDIGDRMILAPSYINRSISLDEITSVVKEYASKYNIFILVPSCYKAKEWEKMGGKLIPGDELKTTLEDIKSQKNSAGMYILVNRYNGIDLPHDSCRMIILDGLPPTVFLKDKGFSNVLDRTKNYNKHQISIIEQGMGRGIRDKMDWCAVMVLGSELSNFIFSENNLEYFSEATKQQISLSKNVIEQIKTDSSSTPIEGLKEALNLFFKRDPNWMKFSKEAVSKLTSQTIVIIDDAELKAKKAFEASCLKQIDNAICLQEKATNSVEENKLKGFFKERLARYKYLQDKEEAKKILESAQLLNNAVIKPWGTIKRLVLERITKTQSQHISTVFDDKVYSRIMEAISCLIISPEMSSNQFENSLCLIGDFLGAKASRPERECTGTTLDVLWQISNDVYILFPCKNNAVANEISKDYIDKAHGEIAWFKEQTKSENYYSIMIHPSNLLHNQATPPNKFKVMNEDNLTVLRKNLRGFCNELSNIDIKKEDTIQGLLVKYKLELSKFIDNYTQDTKRQQHSELPLFPSL